MGMLQVDVSFHLIPYLQGKRVDLFQCFQNMTNLRLLVSKSVSNSCCWKVPIYMIEMGHWVLDQLFLERIFKASSY